MPYRKVKILYMNEEMLMVFVDACGEAMHQRFEEYEAKERIQALGGQGYESALSSCAYMSEAESWMSSVIALNALDENLSKDLKEQLFSISVLVKAVQNQCRHLYDDVVALYQKDGTLVPVDEKIIDSYVGENLHQKTLSIGEETRNFLNYYAARINSKTRRDN